MRAVAVDWSGAAAAATQRKTIWTACAVDGSLVALSAGRTRAETIDHVLDLATPATVIGLDFSFSFPVWWLDATGVWDGPALWERAAREGEGWLRACEPPFWGRPGRPRPAGEGWRRTEREHPGCKSTFQIGGAGTVGTGAVRGMPHLRSLRAAGVAVWPFDDWAPGPVAAEVWPRDAIGRLVKTSSAVRQARVVRFPLRFPLKLRRLAEASPDAFDAACAAVALSRVEPPRVGLDEIDRREGRILPIPVLF